MTTASAASSVDESGAPTLIHATERKVVDRIERVHQPQVLVHETKAGGVCAGKVTDLEGLLRDPPGPRFVRAVEPRQNLDEGGLA